MGLNAAFLDAHIEKWERQLSLAAYPYRKNWPRHLFHHASLDNAVRILTSGSLLSRAHSNSVRADDIAAPDVVANSFRAHPFARLYFRPRTPTQYNVEGIRKSGEGKYGNSVHAPILVMFVFDARRVLLLDGVCFSNSNMQTGAIEMSEVEDFEKIPFEKVYHEGGIGGDRMIVSHRCAEVLAPSPLNIHNCLRWIYCRSVAERATLMHALEDRRQWWDKYIRVSDDLKVFQKDYAFVERVYIGSDKIVFRLHPRHDLKPLEVEVSAYDESGRLHLNFKHNSLMARPPGALSW